MNNLWRHVTADGEMYYMQTAAEFEQTARENYYLGVIVGVMIAFIAMFVIMVVANAYVEAKRNSKKSVDLPENNHGTIEARRSA